MNLICSAERITCQLFVHLILVILHINWFDHNIKGVDLINDSLTRLGKCFNITSIVESIAWITNDLERFWLTKIGLFIMGSNQKVFFFRILYQNQLAGFLVVYVCNEKWILYIFFYSLLRTSTHETYISYRNKCFYIQTRTYDTLSTNTTNFLFRSALYFIIIYTISKLTFCLLFVFESKIA